MTAQTIDTATSKALRPQVAEHASPRRASASARRTLRRAGFVGPLEELAEHVKGRVCGQEPALERLLSSLSRAAAGLNDPDRPLLTALLLGPTGVGKTETVRALAEALFGSADSLVRVNCEEYSHGFELSKLLGAPPGFVGFHVEPLLSQKRLDAAHRALREARKTDEDADLTLVDRLFGEREEPVSVVLFDEVEKADQKVWNALLGVLEEGRLTLGDNSTTTFRRTIIVLTSNVGSRSLSAHLEPTGLGFGRGRTSAPDAAVVAELALDEARRRFPAEFLNRLDAQLVFEPLGAAELTEICDRLVADLQQRVLEQARVPVLLKLTPQARDWLVATGSDPRYGARPLRRVIEREVVDPLADFIGSGQLRRGDVVDVERHAAGLRFVRAPRRSDRVVA